MQVFKLTDQKPKGRGSQGFTLAEMLAAIAIIAVLVGIAFIAASSLLASMRQNKLDTIAQDIYVTAQERLTQMYTDNRVEEVSIKPEGSAPGLFALNPSGTNKPNDWSGSIPYAGLTSFYNRQASATAAILLPAGALSPEVEANHWIIEYNPEYGYIYGVFYSEKAFSPADISGWYSSGKANLYRTYADRKGSGVGYYGGGGVLGGKVAMTATALNISVSIQNAEELKANVAVSIPTEYKEKTLRLTVTYTGETSGKTYERTYVLNAQNYGYFNRQLAITLDSFKKEGNKELQFGLQEAFKEMIRGENVTMRLLAELGTGNLGSFAVDPTLDSAATEITFNSLFAEVQTDEITGETTAYISAGRHLQNLLFENLGVRHVVQIGSIDFENTTPDVADDAINWWQETYPGRNFLPIVNTSVTSFTGSSTNAEGQTTDHIINGMTILVSDNSPAGMFSTLNAGTRITDVHLVGSKIDAPSSAVGALAGQALGNVTLTGTGVYLEQDDYSNKTYNSANVYLLGSTVGGLIGQVDGSVDAQTCFAAEILRNYSGGRVGGLFGTVSGKMTLQRSYSDCYLTAANGIAAGFAASCSENSTIDNCYAAGFTLNLPTVSAGFTPGAVASVSNSYSVLNIGPENPKATGTKTHFYPTVGGGSATNVYYALPEGPEYDPSYLHDDVGVKRSFSQLRSGNAVKYDITNLSAGSFVFGGATGDTTAYNLAPGLGLSNFPYPMIQTAAGPLHHYGDWDGNLFDPGTLVYFEEYLDENGQIRRGYYGAGSNFLDSGDNTTIIRDGYALLYTESDVTNSPYYGTTHSATISCNGEAYTLQPLDAAAEEGKYSVIKTTITGNQTPANYYFRDLPYELLNSSKAPSNVFFTKITVSTPDTKNDENQGVSYYYFNPRFAGTVQQVERDNAPCPSLYNAFKNVVRIRTARQLYLLSRDYQSHHNALTSSVKLEQEMPLDYGTYHWEEAGFTAPIEMQNPIADGSNANNRFRATYNGNRHTIHGVSVISDTLYSGLFGYVDGSGRLNDIFLVANASENRAVGYTTAPQEANNYAYIGVLVGCNQGSISNCAVAGYTMVADSYGTTLYAGGLVGYNNKNIINCSADNPTLTVRTNGSNAFVGAFAGSNDGKGTITQCYSLSSVNTSRYISGTVRVGGFAGSNAGSIQRCYTATAMTVSNIQKEYLDGFTSVGGRVQSCYFLTEGTYKYSSRVFAYGQTSQTANAAEGTAELPGMGINTLAGFGKPSEANSQYHAGTSPAAGNTYPFASSVTISKDTPIHFGDWLSDDVFANFGMLYWEHETSGTNNGYHFYLVDNNGDTFSTLCHAHDDGGVIAEYGYGYYKLNSDSVKVAPPKFGGLPATEAEDLADYRNEAAEADLENQFASQGYASYDFVLYNTSDAFSDTPTGLYLTGSNSSASATYGGRTYRFSPFFGATLTTGTDKEPGQMEIRSLAQLQFLNWNQGYTETTGGGYQYDPVTELTYSKIWDRATATKDDSLRETPYYYKSGNNYSKVYISRYNSTNYFYLSANGKYLTNWESGDTSVSITLYNQVELPKETYAKDMGTKELVLEANYKKFTYLGYTTDPGVATQSKGNAGNNKVFGWTWNQTHDIRQPASVSQFTPIAAAGTSSTNKGYNATLYAWFGSTYNGNSYKIENVNIKSSAYTVGLFGVTAGADMQNIIMYSDSNSSITRESAYASDTLGAYSLGGLVGVVYDYNGVSNNAIENCAIAGYQIIDESHNQQGLGEANVGGLIGVSNGNLTRCSAVTNIKVNCTHTNGDSYHQARYGNFVRVGGLTGATLGKVTDCYTGGKITVGDDTLDENYDTSGNKVKMTDVKQVSISANWDNDKNKGEHASTSVYIGGISGSGFAQNYKNFTGKDAATDLREGSPSFENCYTYVEFPQLTGTIRSIAAIGSMADRYSAANEEYGVSFSQCYYLKDYVNPSYLLENVPSFYYTTSDGSPVNVRETLLANGNKYFDEMLTGNSVCEFKLFKNLTPGKDGFIKRAKTTALPIEATVPQMPGLSLGGSWRPVTTLENGAEINGKYSFPGSDHQLDGRNYPFPAVVTQTSDATGAPVFVHYGSWPKDKGLYSEEFNISLDLLVAGQDTRVVPLSYYENYRNAAIQKDNLQLIYSELQEDGTVGSNLTESAYVRVTPMEKGDGTVDLTIVGLKEGTTTITAKYNGFEADIQVTVTAEFSIQVVPVEVTMEDGNITEVTELSGSDAVPTAFQGDSLYWKLTATNSKDERLNLTELNWRVEPETVDDNFDTYRFFMPTGADYVLLEFQSNEPKTHDVQVTAFDILSDSGQTISGTRSREIQFVIKQDPPSVIVYSSPKESPDRQYLTTLYQLKSGEDTYQYFPDKEGAQAEVKALPIPEVPAGYGAFQGYFIPAVDLGGEEPPTDTEFAKADGSISWYTPIDPDVRTVYVYGQWEITNYTLNFFSGYGEEVKVVGDGIVYPTAKPEEGTGEEGADGEAPAEEPVEDAVLPDATLTYTTRTDLVLPSVEPESVTDSETGRERVFAGWSVTESSDPTSWVAGKRYPGSAPVGTGMYGDATLTAVWSTRYNITYYMDADSKVPIADVAPQYSSYIGGASSISLLSLNAPEGSDRSFIGWKLKASDDNNWNADRLYRGTFTPEDGASYTGDVALVGQWGHSYSITYVTGDGEDEQILEGLLPNRYAEGGIIEFADAPASDSGLWFAGWKYVETEGEAVTGWDPEATYRKEVPLNNQENTYTGNVKLKAQWEVPEYTITYLFNYPADSGMETPEPLEVTYRPGDQIVLHNPGALTEYRCVYWHLISADNSSWNSEEPYVPDQALSTGVTMYGDVTFQAAWDPIPYQIRLNVNGGQIDLNQYNNVTLDEDTGYYWMSYNNRDGFTLPNATRSGYEPEFNWTQEKNQDNIIINTSFAEEQFTPDVHYPQSEGTSYTGSVNLIAQWSPITYTIAYQHPNGEPYGENQTYTTSDSVTLKELPAQQTGYTITGWHVLESDSPAYWDINTVYSGTRGPGIQGNVTLGYSKDIIPYQITYVQPDQENIVSGYNIEKVDIQEPASRILDDGTGKALFFTGWKASYEEGKSGNWTNGEIYQPTVESAAGYYGNVTLTAQYTSRKLTLSANKAGSVTEHYVKYNPDGNSFVGYFGDSIPVPERDNWELLGWFTEGGTQVLDADGNVMAHVEGITSSDLKFDLNGDYTLKAGWRRTRLRFTPTDSLTGSVVIARENSGNLNVLTMNEDKIGVTSVTGDNGNYYWDASQSTASILWTVEKSGNSYLFKNSNNYLGRRYSVNLTATQTTDSAAWTVADNQITHSFSIPFVGTFKYYLSIGPDGAWLESSPDNANLSFYTLGDPTEVVYD